MSGTEAGLSDGFSTDEVSERWQVLFSVGSAGGTTIVDVKAESPRRLIAAAILADVNISCGGKDDKSTVVENSSVYTSSVEILVVVGAAMLDVIMSDVFDGLCV